MTSTFIKNNEILQSELALHPKYGIWYRVDSNELEWLNLVDDIYSSKLNFSRKRILDIGAHIGIFSRIADYYGASYIYAVEPEEHNLKMLEINKACFDNPNELVIDASVVTNDLEITGKTLSIGNSKWNTLTPSLVRKFRNKNRDKHSQHEVLTSNILDLIKNTNPHIIKISVEGYEYQMIEEIFDINYLDKTNIENIIITFSKVNRKTRALLNAYIEKIKNIYIEIDSLDLNNYLIIHFKKI